eukprot:1853344-Alexandrium_andersonii.AAC.1
MNPLNTPALAPRAAPARLGGRPRTAAPGCKRPPAVAACLPCLLVLPPRPVGFLSTRLPGPLTFWVLEPLGISLLVHHHARSARPRCKLPCRRPHVSL